MASRIIGFGAGGHARVMIEMLQLDQRYEIVGLLDPDPTLLGCTVLGIPVLGNDGDLPSLISQGIDGFFVGVGSIGSTHTRQRLYAWGCGHGLTPVSVVHPTAWVSPSAQLGPGHTVMSGAIINTCAQLGANVLVNTRSVVEHDCVLGDHVHVASGAVLASTVVVGEGAHVGAGAVIRQTVQIGVNAIIGAGSVVIRDVVAGTIVVGNPAEQMNYSKSIHSDLSRE